MNITLTSMKIAIYANSGYTLNYQHFASLREELFTGSSKFTKYHEE